MVMGCVSRAILNGREGYPTAVIDRRRLMRAHARELMLMFDLYVAQACAPVQRHRVYGTPLDDAAREAARAAIVRALTAVSRLAQYGPWLAGEYFSVADVSAAGRAADGETRQSVSWVQIC